MVGTRADTGVCKLTCARSEQHFFCSYGGDNREFLNHRPIISDKNLILGTSVQVLRCSYIMFAFLFSFIGLTIMSPLPIFFLMV